MFVGAKWKMFSHNKIDEEETNKRKETRSKQGCINRGGIVCEGIPSKELLLVTNDEYQC